MQTTLWWVETNAKRSFFRCRSRGKSCAWEHRKAGGQQQSCEMRRELIQLWKICAQTLYFPNKNAPQISICFALNCLSRESNSLLNTLRPALILLQNKSVRGGIKDQTFLLPISPSRFALQTSNSEPAACLLRPAFPAT